MIIPGIETYHPRSEWVEDCFPITGTRMKPEDIWQPVAHYSSALNLPDGDIGEFNYQIPPFLRSANRDYWLNRKNTKYTRICNRDLPGYSLGYLFWIDWLGGVWEVRGFDFFSAANAGHNSYTAPFMFITDRHDPASDLAWKSARALWREFRLRSGRTDFRNRPLGHGELYEQSGVGTPTICPGIPIIQQLHSGIGDLDYDEGDEEMQPIAMRPKGFLNVFIVCAANAIHASPEMMAAYGLTPDKIIDFDHPQTLKSLMFKSGMTPADLTPG